MLFQRKEKVKFAKDGASDIGMKLHPFTLHFVDDQAYLEEEYRNFYFSESIGSIRITLVLAIFFYAVFAGLDVAVAKQFQTPLWLIRFAFVIPVLVLLLISSYRPWFRKYVQLLVGIGMYLTGFGIILMIFYVSKIGLYTYYAGLMLIFMIGYTFIRLRIVSATIAGWSIVLTYEIVAVGFAHTPTVALINNNFFFVSANVIGMLICYFLDRTNRRDFYMRKLLEIERNKVKAANDILEQKVQERTQQLLETNVELKKEIELRKQYEKERTKLEAQLMQLQKMETIGTLAGGIAHDFNNILTPILGYTEMALEEIEEDNTLRFDIEQINHAAIRAKDLVQQILTFSRQMDVEKKPSDLKAIIEEVLNLVRASLPRNIMIKTNLKKGCGSVMVDATQIHQVLMNLCTNAAYAMTPDGGDLFIGLKEIELDARQVKKLNSISPGVYANITVTDTGVGMDKQTMQRIFEPFFTKKEVGVGSGLGLAVVHGIINSYRGAITVESAPGKGTTFDIFLPSFSDAKETEISEEFLKTGMEHIMFVDDEEEVTFIGKKMLESLGYSVTIRTDGNRAFQEFKAHPDEYDLLVTDQVMPGLLGTNLAAKFRQLNPKLKVIIITGAKESINEKIIEDYKIDELLLKPLKISEFSKVIRKVLDEKNKNN
ncbi:MAG: response regulator [Bacteroidales bacterium]|nr:response regulator [Bacteroidales bacterium]